MLSFYNKKKFFFYLFILIILVSFYRSPYIFFNGRFFAEEGSVHFQNAFQNGFFKNLYFIELEAGYINLIANILSSIAVKFPLIYAPYATVYGSFIFILLPVYLVLFRDSKLFDKNLKKILGSLILFISTPLVPEIWLNSINLQIYLCLSSIIIIFMIETNIYQKVLNNIIILVGGFSGIYTCSLLPIFFIKFLREKNNYNFTNLIILIIANITQFFLIIHSKINSYLTPTVLKIDFATDSLSLFVYNILVRPFTGKEFLLFFFDNRFLNSKLIIISLLFAFILFLIFLIRMNFKSLIGIIKNDNNFHYLVIIFIIICFIVFIGSVGNYYGGRYAAIPGVVLLLIFLHLAFTVSKKLKYFLMVILIFALFNGVNEFRPYDKNNESGLKILDCYNCPNWKNEIINWQKNNNYIIKIWPYPRKNMRLEI
jgi:hypothetical protein|tara:strand:+ start:2842 stop:4122 length:1281 start_codon:yes stop_codon:yes gene_type:complete